jgi:hypothetical protein
MRKFGLTLFLAAFAGGAFVHADDPRLEKSDVNECFEQAKNFLRSSEYYGEKNKDALIAACRDADPRCVAETGDSLHPSDALTNSDMVKIIKACRGRGMGSCFAALKDTTNSNNRREVSQVLAMLKKCE